MVRRSARILSIASVGFAIGAVATPSARADFPDPAVVAATTRVFSESDPAEAGMMSAVIQPMFAAAFPGQPLEVYADQDGARGSYWAFFAAGNGQIDVTITDSSLLEQQAVAAGHVQPTAYPLFSDDFVLVGSTGDTAGVKAGAPHDFAHAFDLISAAASERSNARFVSRWDRSGTNLREGEIWHLTSKTFRGTSWYDGVDQPGGNSLPEWYIPTLDLAEPTLRETQTCGTTPSPATTLTGSCYALTTRAEFNHLKALGQIPDLEIVSEHNDPAAPGGAALSTDEYVAHVVRPVPPPESRWSVPWPNADHAQQFIDFVRSEPVQAAIESNTVGGQPLFHRVTTPLAGQGTGAATTPAAATAASTTPGSANATTSTTKAASGSVAQAKPTLHRLQLTGHRLTVAVDSAQTVRIALRRRHLHGSGAKRRVTYDAPRRLTINAKRAGTVSHGFRRLPPGTYRLTFRITTAAGAKRTQVATRAVA